VTLTRRDVLLAAAAAPAVARGAAPLPPPSLPAKSAFAPMPYTYLDSGSTHPMSLGAKAALQDYLTYKTRDHSALALDMGEKEKSVIE
jgi:hypothetical protein